MITITLQKEIKKLKERQFRLEAAFSSLLEKLSPWEEEVRPEYLKKLERIRRDMKTGRGVITLRNRREIKEFFRNL